MQVELRQRHPESVALLAEGVDRNSEQALDYWMYGVALLAEGVDRNPVQEAEVNPAPGRPPRGGRG